jgi:hypothetical protein
LFQGHAFAFADRSPFPNGITSAATSAENRIAAFQKPRALGPVVARLNTFTLRRYGHLSDADVRGALDVLDRAGRHGGGTERHPRGTGKTKSPENRALRAIGAGNGIRIRKSPQTSLR